MNTADDILVTLPTHADFIARLMVLSPEPHLITRLYLPLADELAGRITTPDRIVEAAARHIAALAKATTTSRHDAENLREVATTTFDRQIAALADTERDHRALVTAWRDTGGRRCRPPVDTLDKLELVVEWHELVGSHDPTEHRRLVEVSVALAAMPSPLAPGARVPPLGVCPACGRLRELAVPTAPMPGHTDGGRTCPGTGGQPLQPTDASRLVQAILDLEANIRGEFCAAGDADPRHDAARCPVVHRART